MPRILPAAATTLLAAVAGVALFGSAARAASTYVALGDSITFGETDLRYFRSDGDRGYVGFLADYLATQNGGVRPNVVNLAIDGETADSFMDGTGRLPPVTGRGDVILASENANYNPDALVTQSALFASTVQTQRAMGNTIDTVTIGLGFNDLGEAASVADVPATLAAYRTAYSAVLDQVRGALPDANLLVLNYYNPFPANPTSPAAPIFAAGGGDLNATIADLAASHGATLVDLFTPFVGNEAAYTLIDEQPAGSTVGSPFGGVLPVGNVHPNYVPGYRVIANQFIAAVPEPTAALLLAPAAGFAAARRRRSR